MVKQNVFTKSIDMFNIFYICLAQGGAISKLPQSISAKYW